MLELFSDEARRNPFPLYDGLRSTSPVLHVPPPFDLWLIFDYDGVKRALADHETFSSAVPAPRNWFNFDDPPRHTKLRGLLLRAFTPRVVAGLEPRIREMSAGLLDNVLEQDKVDLAAEYAVPLPMMVIAQMLGIPQTDWPRYRRWSDSILKLSYTLGGIDPAVSAAAMEEFHAASAEMDDYLGGMLAQRRAVPRDDLLSGLAQAEVDDERLTQTEILGFFQLFVVAGQETTANLINNAVLSLIEHPQQLALLRSSPQLLESAIEETLRFRSPVAWMMRTPKRDVVLHGQTIPAGALVLPLIGSANHDPQHFPAADQFDITRNPNPHIAFGHGIHACLGAALSRLEARIALSDLLERTERLEPASDEPWEPRKALHVYGPVRLPIRIEPKRMLPRA